MGEKDNGREKRCRENYLLSLIPSTCLTLSLYKNSCSKVDGINYAWQPPIDTLTPDNVLYLLFLMSVISIILIALSLLSIYFLRKELRRLGRYQLQLSRRLETYLTQPVTRRRNIEKKPHIEETNEYLSSRLCPHCGMELPLGDVHVICPYCGRRIRRV